MTFAWREHDEAHEELRAAVRWYEDKRESLGDWLADAVEETIESILDPSIGWGFYLIDGEIDILAYVHERRRPGYWSRRIDGWLLACTRMSSRTPPSPA